MVKPESMEITDEAKSKIYADGKEDQPPTPRPWSAERERVKTQNGSERFPFYRKVTVPTFSNIKI